MYISLVLILAAIITFFVYNKPRKKTKVRTKKVISHRQVSQPATSNTDYNYTKSFKGRILESQITDKLETLSHEYNVYKDVYLYVNNRSVQIDHIVVSPFGVFVIEAKNYTGSIYGSDDAEYWSKYVNEKEYKFRNPLKQNYSHIYALQCILGLPRNYFVSVVIFSDRATIKCETKELVIYTNQLQSVIKSFRTPIMSPNALDTSIYVLNNSVVRSADRVKRHINSINQYIKEKNDLINQGICPKCNGKLVERNGKYGSFLGCSNYPDCKFTKDISTT